jgi:copper chaperone
MVCSFQQPELRLAQPAGNAQSEAGKQGDKPMKDITLAISGMSCGHCLKAVSKAIAAVPGVEIKSVQIGRAEIRVPESNAADQAVRAAVEGAGYTVEGLIAG